MQTRHELTLEILPRYLKANKQEKTKILDEYCLNTNYERKYAIAKLKNYQLTPALKFKVPGKHKRNRKRIYDVVGNFKGKFRRLKKPCILFGIFMTISVPKDFIHN